MALHDRIVFAATQTELLLTLQDAGVLVLSESGVVPANGVLLYSHIGEAYGDGMTYALITMDDALINVAAIDLRLVDNIDPARTPLRIRAGVVNEDPNEAARAKFSGRLAKMRELEFLRYIPRAGLDVVKPFQLRTVAHNQGRLTALDNAVAALTGADIQWRIRWQGADDFTRADLDTITALTANQRDALFAAALNV